ncbi:MAG: hypothetical protein ABW199_07730 [Caulobacterales bacterium]
MLQSKIRMACFVLMAACLAACASAPAAAPQVTQIVSTTSFGMCVGYCSTRLEISASQAVLVRESRGGRGAQNLPAQRFTAALSESEWNELTRLAANTRLETLPPVIGCPDCADGGAESLSITTAQHDPHSITFDHGATIEQAQPLLDRVRALRTRLTPAE